MQEKEKPSYFFLGLELQPDERRLVHGRDIIPLTPKAFEILLLFVENAGHMMTKDELMAAIWPGSFVTESNLTKHIWTLRRALGESDDGDRFIQTVPKVGYRFVAPVSRSADAPATSTKPPPAEPEVGAVQSKPGRFGLQVIGAVIAAVVLGSATWWFAGGRRVLPHNPSGRTIAILQFDNLSKNSKDAWIGPAFTEMLSNELGQDGALHLLPDEFVRSASHYSDQPHIGGLGPNSLTDLRRELAVDYVVTGSYLASEKASDPPIRLDLSLQNARTGEPVVVFSKSGSVRDLSDLVTEAGAELRKDLKLAPQSLQNLRLAQNARPPNADLMRRIGFALNALHRYDFVRAKNELLQAIVQAPDYAPSYAYLAQAWSALGYKQKALAAAKQAAVRAANLPGAMRLEIEAQSYKAQYLWPKAIKTLQQLVSLQPENPEPQFELVSVLLSAGQPFGALKALENIRQQSPSIADDPRFELAAAKIASAQDNITASTAQARRALELAKARGAVGLQADSEVELGNALASSDPKSALEMLNHALADYRKAGNPEGEAATHRGIGIAVADNDSKRSLMEYQTALQQFQALGDQNGIASAYADVGTVLWVQGDRDGAETATKNVLDIRRQTGDIAGQAWALAALAIEQGDESASEEVIAGLRDAAALDARIGAHSHRAFSLLSLSDFLRLRGELVEAKSVCAQAQAEYADVKDVFSNATADYECAIIALDIGDIEEVEKDLAHTRQEAVKIKQNMTLGNVDITQAQIWMGHGKWQEAAKLLTQADHEFGASGLQTGQSTAESLLALCQFTLGDKQSAATLAHAKELRSRINERQEVIQNDIAFAESEGQSGDVSGSVKQLEALAADARTRYWLGWALEAELAELRVLRRGINSRADELRLAIVKEAKAKGYGWVLARANTM
jgi:DNA-binding winged helix-turn-helix (wHTH) protein/tetratricopeptide (TPR) repeat protein